MRHFSSALAPVHGSARLSLAAYRFVGVSAGAIMLAGRYWANWTSDEEAWVGSDEDLPSGPGSWNASARCPSRLRHLHNEEDD